MAVHLAELLRMHPELLRTAIDFDPKLVPGILARGVYFNEGMRRSGAIRAVAIDSHGVVRLEADLLSDEERSMFEEAAMFFLDRADPQPQMELHLVG